MQLNRVLFPTLVCLGVITTTPVVGRSLPDVSSDSWRLCPRAIAVQEHAQGIPKHLLSAIAIAESGRKHPRIGRRMPWPWTVMAEGRGRYLPSKTAAIREVRQLQARGVRNIDVGCMQVNLYHHSDAFLSLDEAFEPSSNVGYAGEFLRRLFESTGSWQEAAGMYHSATPEHKIPYRQRVVRLWNEQQRLEFAGRSSVGQGALTAGLDDLRAARASIRSSVRSAEQMLARADQRLNSARDSRSVRGPNLVNRLAPPLGMSRSTLRGTSQRFPDKGANRQPRGSLQVPVRTLDQEAAFAVRRAQYIQELRQAIAEVKRSPMVQVARDVRGPGSGTAP